MNEATLSGWIAQQVKLLSEGKHNFLSNHVDEIDPEFSYDPAAVEQLLDILPALQRLGGDAVTQSTIMLAIPLGWSTELDVSQPDLLHLHGTDEPPSVYVFAPSYFVMASDREEYRCPVLDSPWDEGYVLEYACGRSIRERVMGWEFSRTLWVRWMK